MHLGQRAVLAGLAEVEADSLEAESGRMAITEEQAASITEEAVVEQVLRVLMEMAVLTKLVDMVARVRSSLISLAGLTLLP